MSWFDKLFGEENDSQDDYLAKRNQRRHKAKQNQNDKDSLLPQNNDVYERPRGKFRFPMSGIEDTDANHSTSNEHKSSSNEQQFNEVTNDGRQRSRRHRNSAYEQNIDRQPESTSTTHSYKQAERPDNKQNNKRIRIQTEVLRAQYSTPSSEKPHYHKSDFKASEVPSAIFGTQKRHKLENGVITNKELTSDTDTNELSNSNQTMMNAHEVKQSDSAQHQTSIENNVKENESYSNDDLLRKGNKRQDQQNTAEQKQVKKDNTVNIENFYASQIVEEIRRERERKVLQKKQFKKALQQKRQSHEDSPKDNIQKAIDEMYAKQAQQYVGESSLDEVDSDDLSKDQSNTEQQHQRDTEHAFDNESSATDITESENFMYEEVNLDNISDVQYVDDDQTSIEDTEQQASTIEPSTTESTYEDSVEQSAADEAIADATYREISEASTNDLEETSHKQNFDQDILNEEAEVEETTEAINENEQEELSEDAATANVTTNVEDSSDDHDDATTEFNENQHNDLDSNDATEHVNDEDTTINQENVQYEAATLNTEEDAETDDSVHNNSSEAQNTASNTAIENNVDEKAEQQTKTVQQSQSTVKRPIAKGSKPFNVVMTPSDKKRMMDANKAKKVSTSTTTSSKSVNVPELKPTSDQSNQTKENSDSATVTNETNNIASAVDSTSEHHTKQGATHDQTIEHSTQQNDVTETTQDTEQHESKEQPQATRTIRRGPSVKLPDVALLESPEEQEVDDAWIEEKKQELNDAFYYFNVPAEVQTVTEGPSVTRFELSVEKGVKVSRITALQDDIKMALAAKDIRIEAPIPGTSLVGIEVPNQSPTKVNIKSIIDSEQFNDAESKLTVAMGYRINNQPLLMDIAKTPHALIAGATGSGKSVCINSILLSLLYKNHPEELKLLLIDPKMVELAPYNDLPHLVSPVITDVKAATQSLKWAVEEMERRYKLFAQYHVRNITAFNKKAAYEDRLPKIVIVIDELADLMMMAPQDVEQSIARIAQKARACGIHMLVATQRPSVNVITGLIKANIPTRIAFMVSSSVDSRTILDSGGAERLLGYGDMLYLGSGMNKPIRVQGSFVSDEEIDDVVDYIKQQRPPEYLFEEKELLKKTESPPQDDLFDDVCQFMVQEGHISTSLIQRHFQIGYNRAARIVDQLEQLGYISEANGSKPRDVYLTETDLNEI
ncbi:MULTISPECIES: DNA translocase FtsK [Staphylococcus]|nr:MULTISPECIES: DNA translocase FtsK [Staphylococcus]PTH21531.1 DNA translocase FtsK [Staphylococcus arlettae]PTH29947.1 DNA translocase FtsK [Staphylococcus arlettae]PTH42768.1 DNA translocase FtsK [Staphylococcus arlettae]PTH53444.1 DNA translocase FtsK [Staphylococcus arlettae]PTH53491.1 DNA translocase FtsK [Staphylococcus arlettae]